MAARAFIGLGSNLGHRTRQLRRALRGLRDRRVQLVRLSSVYESAPVGPIRDQPMFLNAVAEVEVELTPAELLHACLAVEQQMGRERVQPQGPRTIDLDVLLYDTLVHEEPGLILPHPRLCQRAFVLVPLLELDASLADPRTGAPLAENLPALREQALRRTAAPVLTSRRPARRVRGERAGSAARSAAALALGQRPLASLEP